MIDLTALPILDTDCEFSTLPDLYELTWNKFQIFWNDGIPGKAKNVLKIEYYTGALNEYGKPQNSYQVKDFVITLAEGKEVYEKTKLICSDFDDKQKTQIDGLNTFHKQALKHTRNITNDLAVQGSQGYQFGCRTHTSKTKFDEKNKKSKTKFGKKCHSDIIAYFFTDSVNGKTCLRIEWKGHPIIITDLYVVANPTPGQSVMHGYFNTEAMKHQYGRIQNKKGAVLEGNDLLNIKKQQKQLLNEIRAKFLENTKFPTFIPHKIELSKTKLKNQQQKAEQEALEHQPVNQVISEIDEHQQYNLRKKVQRQELLQQLKIEAIDYLTSPEYVVETKEIDMTPQELARSLLTKKKQDREQIYNQKLQEFQEEYDLLVQLCETDDFQTDEVLQNQVASLHESWVERVTLFNEDFADIIAKISQPEEISMERFEEEFPNDPEAQEMAMLFAVAQTQLNQPVKEKTQVQYQPKMSQSGLFVVEGERDHFPVPVDNTLDELERIKQNANRVNSEEKRQRLGITKYDSMIFGDGDDIITREDVIRLYGNDFFMDDYGDFDGL